MTESPLMPPCTVWPYASIVSVCARTGSCNPRISEDARKAQKKIGVDQDETRELWVGEGSMTCFP